MMTERQRKFREQYRAAISRYYSGWVHIGVMYSAGIAAIWYCVSQLGVATARSGVDRRQLRRMGHA